MHEQKNLAVMISCMLRTYRRVYPVKPACTSVFRDEIVFNSKLIIMFVRLCAFKQWKTRIIHKPTNNYILYILQTFLYIKINKTKIIKNKKSVLVHSPSPAWASGLKLRVLMRVKPVVLWSYS